MESLLPRLWNASWLILIASLLAGCTPDSRNDSYGLAQEDTSPQCGFERWDVKTLTDPEANQVNLTPSPTTVEQLAGLPVPAEFSRDAGRLPPEFQTYTVQATLVGFKGGGRQRYSPGDRGHVRGGDDRGNP